MDGTTGDWRGVQPLAPGHGPNAHTLDPEAENLDSSDYRYLKTSVMSALDTTPAEVAVPMSNPIGPSPTVVVAPNAASPPRRASTSASPTAIHQGSGASGATKAPWELRQARRNRSRMIIAAVLFVALVVGGLLFVMGR